MIRKLTLAMALVFMFTVCGSTPQAKAQTHQKVNSQLVGAAGTACTQDCTGLSFSWSYTADPALAVCSTTVTTNCFQGFTAVITSPSGTSVTVPATTIGPTSLTYIWRPGGVLNYGTWSVSLTATAVGATTTTLAQSSPPVIATISYPLTTLNSPTGLSGTPVQ